MHDSLMQRMMKMSYIEKAIDYDQQLDKLEVQLKKMKSKEVRNQTKTSLKHQMKIIQ